MGRTQTSNSWGISVHSDEVGAVVMDVVLGAVWDEADEVRDAEDADETWFDAIKQRTKLLYRDGIHFLFGFNRRSCHT